MRLFDRIFGKDFIESVPKRPGVYRFLNESDEVLYVGKANDLFKRLSQYRNMMGRKKKTRKQRQIVKASTKIELTLCKDETAALLLENKLIQELRPHFNVEGAFSFMYPMIGVHRSNQHLALCYSTNESAYGPSFQMFGTFRSRLITRAAFDALIELFTLLGHPEGRAVMKNYPKVDYSKLCAFRRINKKFDSLLEDFLLGQSSQFLEEITLELLERTSARNRASEVKVHLKDLARFYKEEAAPLKAALESAGRQAKTFIPQTERDALFIRQRSGTAQIA